MDGMAVAGDSSSQWIWGTISQTSTMPEVLTPEYQKRKFK
jgi:hypothetical protein